MNASRSRFLIISLIVALALTVAAPGPARADPGDLDRTFGADGIVTTALPGESEWGNAVALDAEGRIVVAGTSLARFNPDGSLDATFGRGGVSRPKDGVYWQALVLDDLGRIIVAGHNAYDFVVGRYNPDGTPDASFGSDGIVMTDFGTDYDTGNAVTLDHTGRILVTGDGDNNFAVACYLPDGTLDPAFGDGDGLVVIDMDVSYSEGFAIVVDDADQILIAGTVEGYESDHTALARLTRAGELDASFGDNGKVISFLSEEGDYPRAMLLDGAGRIIVAGGRNDEYEKSGLSVARYTPAGVLDTTFGHDGLASTGGIEGSEDGHAMALDSVGRIIVAGNTAVARFMPEGTLDATFDGNGVVSAELGLGYASLYGMALDSAERIIVTGSQWDNTWLNDAIIGRYNTDGTLDDTFGGDGMVKVNFNGDSVGKAVAIDRAGRIAVVGDLPSLNGAGLTCYNPDGSLDTTFGYYGTLVFRPEIYPFDARSLDALTFDTAGRLIMTGWGSRGGHVYGSWLDVYRMTHTGEPDTSFAGDGSVRLLYSAGRPDASTWRSAVAVDSSNRILAAGSACTPTTYVGCDTPLVITVTRIREDGSLDTAFGNDGYATMDFGGQNNDVRAMLVDSFGRIVVTGWVGPSDNRDIALIRLNPDGSPDLSFSRDGKLTADLGGDDLAAAVAMDAENRIIIAGSSDSDFAMLRFNTDGALDATFAGDGILLTNLDGIANGTGVAVDQIGHIIVSGTVNGDFAALRLNSDGTLDPTFGESDGIVTTDLGGNDVANGMTLDALGRVVVAGATDTEPRQRFAVVRYQQGPIQYYYPLILN